MFQTIESSTPHVIFVLFICQRIRRPSKEELQSIAKKDLISLINGIWNKVLNSIACPSLPAIITPTFGNIKYYLFHFVFTSFSFHHHHHHHLKSFLRSIKVNVIDNNIYNFRVFIAIHLIFSSRIQSVFFHFCLCFSHSITGCSITISPQRHWYRGGHTNVS